ncbi:Hypothetical predicted protein, partial [Paramuricea clavata]
MAHRRRLFAGRDLSYLGLEPPVILTDPEVVVRIFTEIGHREEELFDLYELEHVPAVLACLTHLSRAGSQWVLYGLEALVEESWVGPAPRPWRTWLLASPHSELLSEAMRGDEGEIAVRLVLLLHRLLWEEDISLAEFLRRGWFEDFVYVAGREMTIHYFNDGSIDRQRCTILGRVTLFVQRNPFEVPEGIIDSFFETVSRRGHVFHSTFELRDQLNRLSLELLRHPSGEAAARRYGL